MPKLKEFTDLCDICEAYEMWAGLAVLVPAKLDRKPPVEAVFAIRIYRNGGKLPMQEFKQYRPGTPKIETLARRAILQLRQEGFFDD